ncbi:MAG: sugar ABC transporter substrate-binding protein [Armatimonadota bacterium]
MARRILLFAVLAALLWVAGCPKPKAETKAVALLLSVPDSQMETWQKAVTAFTEASKVEVSLQNVPQDSYQTKLSALVAASAPPDLIAIPSTAFPQLVTTGQLADLKSFLQAQTNVRPSDYVPAAMRAFQYQGSTYGLPYDVSVVALAYNQDLFELQGLREPAQGWTWSQYLKTAAKLTRDSQDTGTIDTWGTTVTPFWQVCVWQSGGDVVDDVANPQRSTLSTPEAQQGLQALADLTLKQKVAPGPAGPGSAGRTALFAQGKVALAYITREDLPVLNKAPDLRWGAVAIPTLKVAANLGLSSGLCIPKNAAHQQQAWQLLAYLAGSDGQKQLLNGSFITPSLEALAGSEYFPGVGTNGANPFLSALKVIHALPFTPRYREIAAVWDEELPALWTGKQTVAQVTARIDERVNGILAQSKPTTAWLLPLMPRG